MLFHTTLEALEEGGLWLRRALKALLLFRARFVALVGKDADFWIRSVAWPVLT